MIRNFRLRIALLSALLSGLALTAFGFGALWQVRRIKLAQLDASVRSHAERESGRTRDAAGWQRASVNMAAEIGVHDPRQLLLLVTDGEGNTIYRSADWPREITAAVLPWPAPTVRPRRSPPSGPSGEPRPPNASAPPPASTSLRLVMGGGPYRIGLASTTDARVAVAADEIAIAPELRSVRSALWVATPLALVLIGFGAWFFSGSALRPVAKLTIAARNVTAQGLDRRISPQGEDLEFIELIEVFNAMLERLERSFHQAHRFSADAAHELKTPLAVLQGQLERSLQYAEDSSPMQARLAEILDEVRRLSTISRKLLLLSQADAGRLSLHREPFDLSSALSGLADDAQMLAPGLQITSGIQPGLVVPADGALLSQVLHNLISNSIKHNIEHGWVSVYAALRGDQIAVVIANSSPGIPLEERAKIFERFYRAASAREHRVEGSGLGLSVSREIVRAHSGDITLEVTSDGTARFTVLLPRSS